MDGETVTIGAELVLHQNRDKYAISTQFQQRFLRILSKGVEKRGRNSSMHLGGTSTIRMMAIHRTTMPKRRNPENQNLLFFPDLDSTVVQNNAYGDGDELMSTVASVVILPDVAKSPGANCNVVISGSYRKDF